MSASEAIWSFGLLGVLLLALLLVKRVRRRTADFHESVAFKVQLPGWVKQFESLTFCGLVVVGMVSVAWLFFRVLGPARAHATAGVAAIYFALGAGLIVIPLSGLGVNLLGWLLPPVRAANERAMSGTKVTLASANRGLLYFGAVSVPLGLVLLVLAAVEPWKSVQF